MRAGQISREKVVEMLRNAGHRELADEAVRVLPDPVDLEYAAAWVNLTGLPETVSSAGLAVALDTEAELPRRPAVTT